MSTGNYHFLLGEVECVSLSDGSLDYPLENFFANVPIEQVKEALRQHNLPTDYITTPYTYLYVDTGQHRVLVDMGAGHLGPRTGKLLQNMQGGGGNPLVIHTGKGLPDGIWGKVGVAVAPSDPRRVYALIEHQQGGLFRSDDGGATWKRVNAHRALRQPPWYYSTLTVGPVNANDVWFPQVSLYRTIDVGATIQPVKVKTGWDHHDIWIDPRNPKRIIDGSDAGVNISDDGGETWRAPQLPISQFYHVSADTRVPFHVAGAIQDLGTLQGPSRSLTASGISRADWYSVGGGEAGHVVSDPSDPNIVYAGEYLGIITRYDHRTRQARMVSAWPEYPSGWAAEQMRYRFQWTAPIAIRRTTRRSSTTQ